MGTQVDASNSCIPPTCNLTALTPPLPTATRGEPVYLDGKAGRINSDRPVIVYGSGRLVIVRELSCDGLGGVPQEKGGKSAVKAFVYRGHTAQVTCAKFSPSGCYIASGDVRGKLRVWSYDNPEHLCKLDLASALFGSIRDIAWDGDSKRLAVVGEGARAGDATNGACARVIQWDTGVTVGELGQHVRNRATSCDFKKGRPMRIVTGGGDDSRCLFNKGPPFARVVDDKVAEQCHTKGAIYCVRFSTDGSAIASVGTDKSICFYDGKTMELLERMEGVHNASIYACAWSSKSDFLLTCSADGTVKLIKAVGGYEVVHTWNVAGIDLNTKVPMGAMQMGCAFVNGDIPISISLNGEISILPLPGGLIQSATSIGSSKRKILTGHQSPISSYVIDHSTGVMHTGDSDGVICKWDVRSNTAIGRIEGLEEGDTADDMSLMNKVHTAAITGMTCLNGTLLSIGWDDKIRLTQASKSITSINIEAQPNSLAKGTTLAVVLTVKGLLLVKENKVISDLISTSYETSSVCISNDDKTVYVGGKDTKIHVYDVQGTSLVEKNILDCHLHPIHSLSLSNDGTKLASADVRDVCVWSIEGEAYTQIIGRSRWCFHQQRINTLSWSNDDSVVASGGNDDSIYIWSLEKKMKRIHYAFAHRGGVTGVEFLKNVEGMVLLSVGNDGCVNQWDVTDDVAKKFG